MSKQRPQWLDMFVIILVCGVIAGGVIPLIAMVTEGQRDKDKMHESTRAGSSLVRTVEHDGHLWVLYSSGGIVHHPDCKHASAKE